MTVLTSTLRLIERHPDNRPAVALGAGWVFLLGSLELERVVVAGEPPAHAVRMLESIARQVEVMSEPGAAHRALVEPASLLWIPPNGPRVAVAEADTRRAERRLVPAPGDGGVPLWHLWDDRPRYSVAADDTALVGPLRRLASDRGPGLRNRLIIMARRRRRMALRAVRTQLVDAGGAAAGRLPDYLAQALDASEAGQLTRWTLVTTAEYPSQKAVFLLYAAGATHPSAIVKLPMSPVFDDRLENERRALSEVSRLGGEIASRVPRPLAFTRHGSRSILAESALVGRPFTSVTRRGATCGFLDDAVQQLTELAAATRTEHPGGTVAAALHQLVERYATAYDVPRQEVFALLECVAAIGRHDRVPAVLEHGDPGVWNLMVDDAGRTLFTDWETSDPAGMPTWDLLHLFRSYAMLHRRLRRDSQFDAFATHLVRGSALSGTFNTALARYAATLRIDADLLEPLYQLCWVQRAVKEATRLEAGRRASGHYRRLVALNVRFRGRLAVLSS